MTAAEAGPADARPSAPPCAPGGCAGCSSPTSPGTIGQQVLTLAVGLHVLDRTSSRLWVSVTLALAFAPYALLSGYAGTLADRCSRSAVLAWSSLV